MLLTNRRTLLNKQIDVENEVRGTLRAFGLKLSGRITQATFEKRALEVVEESSPPGCDAASHAYRVLIVRTALRQQVAVLRKMLLDTRAGERDV